MTTGVLGAGQVFPAGNPFETQTMMFPMVLPLPRTSTSFGTGPECFLAHAGSASMASGLSVGAFPSNVTVPVMVEAATATPGHIDNATSPATRHNLFPLQRMLGSLIILVIANSPPSSPSPLLPFILEIGECTPGPLSAQPPILSRSRRPAMRKPSGRAVTREPAVNISQLAAATTHPPSCIGVFHR